MKPVRLVLEGTQRTSLFCPVSVRLEHDSGALQSCTLIDTDSDMPVPHQIEPLEQGCRLHWIVDSAAPGQRKLYALRKSSLRPGHRAVAVRRHGKGCVDVKIGGQPFTRYLYGGRAARSCLYPILGPFGDGVTRAFPLERIKDDSRDHPHHRSLYVAWGDVNGSDNWSEEKGHGRNVHRQFEATEGGHVFGRIAARNDWLDAGGRRLLRERMEMRFYSTPPAFRIFDVSVQFHATEGDVRFGDTKEGGILSARVASSMEVRRAGSQGRIENSVGGTNEAETWGKKASWCDYSGLVEGNIVGLALFDHPENPRYPTYWHVRNYGLMTANPFGESHFIGPDRDGSLLLPAGESAAFHYRVFVHAGRAADADVSGRYLDWVFAPAVTVEP